MCTVQLGPDNYSVSYGSLPHLKVSIGDVEELRDCFLSNPTQRADFLVSMRVVPLWRPTSDSEGIDGLSPQDLTLERSGACF